MPVAGAGPYCPARTWLRVVTGVVIAFITLADLLAAVRLVVNILTSNKLFASTRAACCRPQGDPGAARDRSGLWYSDLDVGSPGRPSPSG